MAKADSAAGPPPAADALADLREDVEEDEAQQERLHQGPDDELDEVLAQHHQVAEDQGPQGDPAGRRTSSGSASVCDGGIGGLGARRRLISRAAPCR